MKEERFESLMQGDDYRGNTRGCAEPWRILKDRPPESTPAISIRMILGFAKSELRRMGDEVSKLWEDDPYLDDLALFQALAIKHRQLAHRDREHDIEHAASVTQSFGD